MIRTRVTFNFIPLLAGLIVAVLVIYGVSLMAVDTDVKMALGILVGVWISWSLHKSKQPVLEFHDESIR